MKTARPSGSIAPHVAGVATWPIQLSGTPSNGLGAEKVKFHERGART